MDSLKNLKKQNTSYNDGIVHTKLHTVYGYFKQTWLNLSELINSYKALIMGLLVQGSKFSLVCLIY
jgi:hypothetical protein